MRYGFKRSRHSAFLATIQARVIGSWYETAGLGPGLWLGPGLATSSLCLATRVQLQVCVAAGTAAEAEAAALANSVVEEEVVVDEGEVDRGEEYYEAEEYMDD